MSELEKFRETWIEEIIKEPSLTPEREEKLIQAKFKMWELAGFKTPSVERDAYMEALKAKDT